MDGAAQLEAPRGQPSDAPTSTWGFVEGEEIAPGLLALDLLGGGSRFEAYLAFDERLRYVVVAKVLRPDHVEEGSALRGLRREADILASLNHPVIIRLLDARTDGDRPHLVLEFADGPRVSTIIRRFGRLDPEQAAPLAVELASALHYLHGLDLVHLDVKPKNAILGSPPRLIDLSIARSIEDAAHLHVPIGTDAFMAPEQCRPTTQVPVGPPADVWGLGVTLHESVTGSLPFARGVDDDDAPLEDRFPQLASNPEPVPIGVPEPLAEAIRTSLAPVPADRPTAGELADLVEPLLSTPRRFVLKALRPG